MMKERFKAGEWERLLRLPPLMFQFVALADRQLQPQEAAAFATEIQLGRAYKDPLHRELFAGLAEPSAFRTAYEAVVGTTTDSVKAIEREFKAIRKVLTKRLTTEEYHRFFVSLTGTGLKVADAAGEGSSNISTEEAAAIAVDRINGGGNPNFLSPEGETFRWVTDARAITESTADDSNIGVPVAAELEAQVAAYAEVGVYGDGGAPSTEGRFDTDVVAGLYDDNGTVIWPG